ncbi:MAG TPA: DUF748 domain-containing protein [Candidatus Sulfotelmatobacter sp.]|nr:DUF748 domain-containing protein [Candidatus Sulfotelmatobacter sp.]
MAVRLALPYAVQSYVNHALNKSKDYSGSIGHVRMRLWRGGYRIYQVGIFKRDGNVRSPLFAADEVELSIEWRQLFHGSVVGEVVMRQPKVNFVEGPTPDQSQSGKEEDWGKMLESLFPFDLNRLEITNGEVHFQNPASKPPVDIYASRVFVTATNLSNARDVRDKLPSGVNAHGSIFGNGRMDLQLHMNLLKPRPAFEINCGVTNVNLVDLNNFLRAYGKFDVERGNFALYLSVAEDQDAYDGYFKVFFTDLNVFEWEKDREKNVLEIFWQAVVGGAATIFKNHSNDRLAAKIPISGSNTNSSVGLWTGAATLLENAFVHALTPKLDQPATVEQIDKKDGN